MWQARRRTKAASRSEKCKERGGSKEARNGPAERWHFVAFPTPQLLPTQGLVVACSLTLPSWPFGHSFRSSRSHCNIRDGATKPTGDKNKPAATSKARQRDQTTDDETALGRCSQARSQPWGDDPQHIEIADAGTADG